MKYIQELLSKRLINKRYSFIKKESIGLWFGEIDYLPLDHWMRRRFRYSIVKNFFKGNLHNCSKIHNEYQNF